jgi:thiamine-monophosphate kinase
MELDFISWLEQYTRESGVASGPSVVLGIGDDGAILRDDDGSKAKTVWVTDTIVDKVHFDIEVHSLERIGHKAMAVNLSDVAAMGATPEAALITILFPSSMSVTEAHSLFRGMANTAAEFGLAIIGGDTNRHRGPLTVGVAMTGRLAAEFKCADGWRMDRSKPGDAIVVSGSLGGSLLSKHLEFQPRIRLARWLQQNYAIRCATDITDSLAVDLGHVVRKSGVSAILDLDSIPISKDAVRMAADTGTAVLDHALFDGEDFELLFTIEAETANKLLSDQAAPVALSKIGEVTDSFVGELRDRAGNEISQRGFEH